MIKFKALEAIDDVGHHTGVRYSQLNKHRTFREVKEYERKILEQQGLVAGAGSGVNNGLVGTSAADAETIMGSQSVEEVDFDNAKTIN